jgi:hypothetical protein
MKLDVSVRLARLLTHFMTARSSEAGSQHIQIFRRRELTFVSEENHL